MIKRVEINGYQSLYKVGFDLGQFVVIYGESDVGKSALYRAIRGLVSGETGDSFISKGRKSCKVVLALDNGATVTWVKKEGTSSEYLFQEKPDSDIRLFKRSRRLPSELASQLRFGELEVDGERVLPNFHGQFDQLFLLFETPGRKARLVGSLISNILLYGIRQANILRNRNESDSRSIVSLIDELEKHQKFDWDGFLAQVRATRKVLSQVEKGSELLEKIRLLLSKRSTYEKLSTFSIGKIPENVFKELGKLCDTYENLSSINHRRSQARVNLSHIEGQLLTSKTVARDYESKLKEMEKKLVFPCPHCGKDISKLEIDI